MILKYYKQNIQDSTDNSNFSETQINVIINNFLYHIFDAAFQQIWRLLQTDSFARFRTSNEYKLFNEELIRSRNDRLSNIINNNSNNSNNKNETRVSKSIAKDDNHSEKVREKLSLQRIKIDSSIFNKSNNISGKSGNKKDNSRRKIEYTRFSPNSNTITPLSRSKTFSTLTMARNAYQMNLNGFKMTKSYELNRNESDNENEKENESDVEHSLDAAAIAPNHVENGKIGSVLVNDEMTPVVFD